MPKSLLKSCVNWSKSSDATTLFASNFAFLLKSRGVTTDEFSAKTSISTIELSKIEQGNSQVSTSLLLVICSYFRISLDSLLRHDLASEDSHINHSKIDRPSRGFYAWLESKGYNNINTPREQVENFLKQQTCAFEISVTEQFAQQYLLDVIITVSSIQYSHGFAIYKISANLHQFHSHAHLTQHSFHLPECNMFNIKEIFNLLCGRSVFKVLNDSTPDPQAVWLKINFNKKISNSQYEIEKYSSNYGFHLESVLRYYNIVECETLEGVTNIVGLLKEGSKILVTFRQIKKGILLRYIEANPVSRVLRITPFNQ
jgi:transcriptional regulator with XRE-family HTH domain